MSGWEFKAVLALDRERTSWLRKPASERQKMIPATPDGMAKALRSLAGGNSKRAAARRKERPKHG